MYYVNMQKHVQRCLLDRDDHLNIRKVLFPLTKSIFIMIPLYDFVVFLLLKRSHIHMCVYTGAHTHNRAPNRSDPDC